MLPTQPIDVREWRFPAGPSPLTRSPASFWRSRLSMPRRDQVTNTTRHRSSTEHSATPLCISTASVSQGTLLPLLKKHRDAYSRDANRLGSCAFLLHRRAWTLRTGRACGPVPHSPRIGSPLISKLLPDSHRFRSIALLPAWEKASRLAVVAFPQRDRFPTAQRRGDGRLTNGSRTRVSAAGAAYSLAETLDRAVHQLRGQVLANEPIIRPGSARVGIGPARVLPPIGQFIFRQHTPTLSLVRERASEKPSARSLSTEADEKVFSL
jgi:hypothetical protein